MLHQPKFAPVPMLAADVNCFWALEQDQESYNREDFLPDSFAEVVINVGAPLILPFRSKRMPGLFALKASTPR